MATQWSLTIDCAYLADPARGRPSLSFLKVPEPKVAKNRLHLDVQVGGDRDGTPWEIRRPRARGGGTAGRRGRDSDPHGHGAGQARPHGDGRPRGNEFDLI
jgi:hypothetical protein